MKINTPVLLAALMILTAAPAYATTGGIASTGPELDFAVVPTGQPETQVGAWTASGLTIIGALTSQGQLTGTGGQFSGDVLIGEDATGCGGSTFGTLRYDRGSGTLQYCNPGGWQQVAGGVPSGTICGGPGILCQGHNPYWNDCPSGYHPGSLGFSIQSLGNQGGSFATCINN